MPLDFDRFAATLVRTMTDAVVYSDAEGLIRVWNGGAERMFGFTAAEAIGLSLDIIIPPPQRKRHWDGYAETMRTGESRYAAGAVLAVPALRKDGTRVSVEFTIVPFHDDEGRMQGIAAVMRDVTERFEEIRALRRAVAVASSGGGGSPT